jgi:hypothetical protein
MGKSWGDTSIAVVVLARKDDVLASYRRNRTTTDEKGICSGSGCHGIAEEGHIDIAKQKPPIMFCH